MPMRYLEMDILPFLGTKARNKLLYSRLCCRAGNGSTGVDAGNSYSGLQNAKSESSTHTLHSMSGLMPPSTEGIDADLPCLPASVFLSRNLTQYMSQHKQTCICY
jgi:hypothetical protein